MARRNYHQRTIVPGIYEDAWVHDGDKGDSIGSRPRLSVTIGSGVNADAWGKLKVSSDFSLFHGMFTFEVPTEFWKESLNGVELTTLNNASSVNGKLHLTSNGVLNDEVVLDTYRSPRYQPNRGIIYSTSIFLPNPTNLGTRDFGAFTGESGVFFRLVGDGVNWQIFGVARTTVNGITTDTEYDMTNNLPVGFDPSKGNIYDIQCQWRGVGNLLFFVGDEESGSSMKTLTVKNLNKLTELSFFNPALPMAFNCINQGDVVVLESGCVDVSSEGGSIDRGFYGSIGITTESGSTSVTGFNAPVLVVKNRRTAPITNQRNTRDMVALLATAYSDQKSVFRIWATRDETAITLNDQVWIPYRDGLIEYLEYDNPNVTNPITFDTTKAELIFTARINLDASYSSSALFEGRTDIFQSAGDIFIFTVHRDNGIGANAGVTYEFAEEI